jgi:RNA polymerase sigma-70 factor (ECF subfamily)
MFGAEKIEKGSQLGGDAGRAELFDQLILRHSREIQLFLYKLCGNHHDAEELAQDVFVKAYRKLDVLREQAASRRWLYTIAINHFNDWLKPKGRLLGRRALSLDENEPVVDPGDRPIDELMAGELSGWLRDAVARLPERQRSVLLLFSATGFDYGEIGAALGISPDAVKMSLFHAREKLRAGVDRFLKR